MAPQQCPGYPGFYVSSNDVAAPPVAKRTRYNLEPRSLLSSSTVMKMNAQFVDQSMFASNSNRFLYPVNVLQTPFNDSKTTPTLSVVEVEYPRPVWKYSQMIAFALLNLPNETAKVPEISDFIVDNFPFFKASNGSFLSHCRAVIAKETKLFKKIEGSKSNKIGFSCTLVDRSGAKGEIKKLIAQYNSENDVKRGMKTPGLLDVLMSEKPQTMMNSVISATAMVTNGAPIDIFKTCDRKQVSSTVV